jgi:isoamylase
MRMLEGRPHPLGATWDGTTTNFAVFSGAAERVDLCLFDEEGRETRFAMIDSLGDVWHVAAEGVGPGQRYGFRVHGPWNPAEGLLCNPNKLLLDPYARALDGTLRWHDSLFPHVLGGGPGEQSPLDSAPHAQRSVVIDPSFDWKGDVRLERPWHGLVIYEAHVKGMTKLHPEVPEALRGTYAGLAHPAVVEHLVALGVTAVELLPIHAFLHARHLVDRGLRQYWGYDTLGFLAPHGEYAAARDPQEGVREFKSMVRALHAAGIEVILDVVYNHTAEGSPAGPMLSLKGFDAPAYYRLDPADRSRFVDYTGTGNSLNMQSPHVLQLIMDSLRYWAVEMHVDGFRFDLAPVLARELSDVDRLSSFFDIIHQDPVMNRVKLIAEPWDLGPGGYQVGNFPPLWSEWNGRYRDSVRDFWRGQGSVAELARRISGSSDLYQGQRRLPRASVNFVTAHDGFTLRDLVSYDHKHDEANGEDNRDGESHNRSWNCGVEGPTDDPAVLALRARQQRNFLTTLALSQGVPMIAMGDELGRSQGGNNNAYCQDNEVSWMDWRSADRDLLEFTRRLLALRRGHPVFTRHRFLEGERDIAWLAPGGEEMDEARWNDGNARALTVLFHGGLLRDSDATGRRLSDDAFALMVNAWREPVGFRAPPSRDGVSWTCEIDTAQRQRGKIPGGASLELEAHSLVLLRRPEPAGESGSEPAGEILSES